MHFDIDFVLPKFLHAIYNVNWIILDLYVIYPAK